MKNLLGVIILFSLMSCQSDDNGDENIFEFNLNNSYRIESTGTVFETSNAFEEVNIPEFKLILTDSEIGDELTPPCCNTPWDYIINPTTEVKITFFKSKNDLRSGVYTYEKDALDNDFFISVKNEMNFDSDNKLVSQEIVANPSSSDNAYTIENAQIELLFGQVILELNYIIELNGQKRIVGSYIGDLSSFTYNYCYADCD